VPNRAHLRPFLYITDQFLCTVTVLVGLKHPREDGLKQTNPTASRLICGQLSVHNPQEQGLLWFFPKGTSGLYTISRTDQLLIDHSRNQWREIPPFHQCCTHNGKNPGDFLRVYPVENRLVIGPYLVADRCSPGIGKRNIAGKNRNCICTSK
jgi:hypothetical protein